MVVPHLYLTSGNSKIISLTLLVELQHQEKNSELVFPPTLDFQGSSPLIVMQSRHTINILFISLKIHTLKNSISSVEPPLPAFAHLLNNPTQYNFSSSAHNNQTATPPCNLLPPMLYRHRNLLRVFPSLAPASLSYCHLPLLGFQADAAPFLL